MKPIEKFYFNSFDGTRLAAYRFGEGTPIILLHGLFSSAEMNWIKWDHHAKIAKAGFEVVMLDFRAHGSSASPTDPKNYPLNVLVQDTATLLNHLGIRDFFLGGFSLGARTSIHAVANEILDPKGLIIAGMGIEGLSSWNKRAIHFKRIIDANIAQWQPIMLCHHPLQPGANALAFAMRYANEKGIYWLRYDEWAEFWIKRSKQRHRLEYSASQGIIRGEIHGDLPILIKTDHDRGFLLYEEQAKSGVKLAEQEHSLYWKPHSASLVNKGFLEERFTKPWELWKESLIQYRNRIRI